VADYRRPHVLNPYNVGKDDLDWFFRTGSFNRPLHSSSDLSATPVLAALHRNPLPDWGCCFAMSLSSPLNSYISPNTHCNHILQKYSLRFNPSTVDSV